MDESSEPYTSYDLSKNVKGIDFIIDGHSHTVMTAGPNKEAIQSTGTAFANIGVITIDNATKKIVGNELKAVWHTEKNADGKSVTVVDYKTRDEKVAAAAKAIIDPIDKAYGEKFAVSKVELNGAKAPNGNRDSETNLGDLITDAMLWKIRTQATISVPAENVVAITNGGGIRATVKAGDVTKKDINTVLPFGNTLAVVYVTGAELLEALEASTYCTPESIGGFPQAAGLTFTVKTYEKYDANPEPYPKSTYYGPKSIQRVTIDNVNGKVFDPTATYAVVTNNFVAGGGDTYYAFAAATNQFDTGLPLDEVVMEYVTKELKGVIGEIYAEPAGRITVDQGIAPVYAALQAMILDKDAYTAESYSAYAAACAKMDAAATEAERLAVYPAVVKAAGDLQIVGNTFADAQSGWYKAAVDFAQASGLMSGVGGGKFAPGVTTTRAMVAQVLYEAEGAPSVEGKTCPLTDVAPGQWYTNAVIWAYNAGVISGRGAETTMDISADLEELAQTPVMVVCAGAKAILDLGLTLEYLETKGVPVLGYGTDELPAFYTRESGLGVDARIDTPEDLAAVFQAQRDLGLKTGMLVTNPIPQQYAMDKAVIDKAIDQALAESHEQGIHGKETTPFLLARVAELTGGDSLESNIQLVLNNARVAAKTAVALCK